MKLKLKLIKSLFNKNQVFFFETRFLCCEFTKQKQRASALKNSPDLFVNVSTLILNRHICHLDISVYLIFLVFHVLHVVKLFRFQLVNPVPHVLSPFPQKHKVSSQPIILYSVDSSSYQFIHFCLLMQLFFICCYLTCD